VNSAVERVTGGRGGIEVPAQGVAGWYAGGPRPGERGRAVIIGHLDSSRGAGVFARVPRLRRGSAIEVTDRRGRAHRYRVVGLTQVRKTGFPTRAVYGPARRPVLVLVTCGGPYVAGRGYRDNILVYARAA
jgi:sortase (surface protein transpeptidase)